LAGLAGYVRRHRIDVVHASEKPRDAVFGVTAAGVGGARSVLHLHVKPAGWMSRPVRTALARASAIVGVSRFVADSAVALGYPAAKVHAVLNGLELESWLQGDGENTTAADRAAVRAEFAMADDAPLLVSASRLFHWKGQHLAIEALPAVTARFPRVVLLVVGADDTTAGGGSSYSADLRRLVDDLGVADNVRFTGWRRDVRRLISAADVFVLPSFEEPFGMVYLEAMALRRPVVGLDNGGTAEVVDHDGSGLLSPPADAAALAANLVRLLADPGLRHRMGQHGHRRVVTSFGSERMTADMVALYERMVPVPRSETRSPRPPGIVDASVGG
jgi:glycosyltransferase involved in cell wall biosynthesis